MGLMYSTVKLHQKEQNTLLEIVCIYTESKTGFKYCKNSAMSQPHSKVILFTIHLSLAINTVCNNFTNQQFKLPVHVNAKNLSIVTTLTFIIL